MFRSDDLLCAGQGAELAREDRILLPLFGARVIPVPPLAVGHRQIGLLDAGEHLLVEELLQRAGSLKRGLSPGVLSREVRRDPRVGLVAEPVVVVLERLAMERDRMGNARSNGWMHRTIIGDSPPFLTESEDGRMGAA